MTADLRTKHEIERERKHREIINDFLALKGAAGEASDSRIIDRVAERHGFTAMGVRGVLKRNNII